MTDKKEYMKEYYAKTKERRLAYAKKRYQENREALLEQNRLYKAQNPDKWKQYSRMWRGRNPEKVKEYNLKKYKISPQEKIELLALQDGKCAICGVLLLTPRAINVDHCHVTNRIRGILCVSCNTTLGKYERLKSGFDSYILRWKG